MIEGCEAFMYAFTVVPSMEDRKSVREGLYRRIYAMNADEA
jgi:hypothetical protein